MGFEFQYQLTTPYLCFCYCTTPHHIAAIAGRDGSYASFYAYQHSIPPRQALPRPSRLHTPTLRFFNMAFLLASGVVSEPSSLTTSTGSTATLSSSQHISSASSLALSASVSSSSSTSNHAAATTMTTSTLPATTTSSLLVTADPNQLNGTVDATAISWGPDITAAPLATQEVSSSSSLPPPAHAGLSLKSKQIAIAVSVIGKSETTTSSRS